jgi:hypothetical protein|nr:MAG TPA: hypothetical protein [Caudoviricetes sp.]
MKIVYLTQSDKNILDRAPTLSNEEIGKILKQLDQLRVEDQFLSIILNIYYNCNLLKDYDRESESKDWLNDTQEMSDTLMKVLFMQQGLDAMKRL